MSIQQGNYKCIKDYTYRRNNTKAEFKSGSVYRLHATSNTQKIVLAVDNYSVPINLGVLNSHFEYIG